MGQNILTASEKMSHEYCASVVRVGEIHPLENSDNLEKTLINGNSFVIEKGTLHTGDIAFYVENECEINSQFLSINNQYEISEYTRNSNAAEIEEYLKLGSVHKEIANKKEKQLKKLKLTNWWKLLMIRLLKQKSLLRWQMKLLVRLKKPLKKSMMMTN